MTKIERKRQSRLWLSCTECHLRKVKCDRARPCNRCVKADIAGQCRYDLHIKATQEATLGQFVFAVGEADGQQHQDKPQREPTSGEVLTSSIEKQPSNVSYNHNGTPSTTPFSREKDLVAPLQLFWHGSRSVDTYVEPLHERPIAAPKEVIFGENDATVYWGRSHETNFVPRITDAAKLLLKPDKEDDVSTLYDIERSTRPRETLPVRAHDAELRALLPSREETDRLVDAYFRTFESYYKIIHVPSFLKDYARLWDTDPAVSAYGSPNFLAQLLGICAIGFGLVGQVNTAASLPYSTVGQWIEAVRLWLFKQNPRAQMTLGHLQAHLLMLVAGDVHWIKIDRSWISAGMLVRNAVSAGLHREPSDFTRISPFYAELRRRLWFSILEFDLQASFAKGRAPSIRDEDYDCCQPADIINDDMLNEGMTDAQIKATTQSMHTSLPPLYACLAKSLSLRMRVCRLVNGIKLTISYEQVLKLDAELKTFLNEATPIIQIEMDIGKRILLSILTRRAIIALHAPFVARTLHDPRYLYSRQVCTEMAIAVLTEALSLPESGLFATINNICRCEISNSVFLICHELLTQAIERRRRQALTMSQSSGPQQTMVDLVERTAQAVAAICKPDIVSQRTCAWMQLSAELSRAAVGDDAMTVMSMKASIRRSIQAYQTSIRQGEPQREVEPNVVGENYYFQSTDFARTVDEDYFNLFLNLNNVEGITEWI